MWNTFNLVWSSHFRDVWVTFLYNVFYDCWDTHPTDVALFTYSPIEQRFGISTSWWLLIKLAYVYTASLWVNKSFYFSEVNMKELINLTLLRTLPECLLEELLYVDPIALHFLKTFLKICFIFCIWVICLYVCMCITRQGARACSSECCSWWGTGAVLQLLWLQNQLSHLLKEMIWGRVSLPYHAALWQMRGGSRPPMYPHRVSSSCATQSNYGPHSPRCWSWSMGRLPHQLEVGRVRGEGIFPSSPPPLHSWGRQYQLCPSHALRATSPVLLYSGSTLLYKAQGPFSQVIQLVRSCDWSPICLRCRRVRRKGHLSHMHAAIGRREGRDQFSRSHPCSWLSPAQQWSCYCCCILAQG